MKLRTDMSRLIIKLLMYGSPQSHHVGESRHYEFFLDVIILM